MSIKLYLKKRKRWNLKAISHHPNVLCNLPSRGGGWWLYFKHLALFDPKKLSKGQNLEAIKQHQQIYHDHKITILLCVRILFPKDEMSVFFFTFDWRQILIKNALDVSQPKNHRNTLMFCSKTLIYQHKTIFMT